MRKKIVLSCVFLLVSESFVASLHAGSGGDAAVGGFAGSMVGGLMSGAMTRGSSDGGSRRSASKMMRELDKLEDAVYQDLKKLNGRIDDLARDVERVKDKSGSDEIDALKKEIKETNNALKKLETSIDDRFESLDDRFAAIEKTLKRIETKPSDDKSNKDPLKEKSMDIDKDMVSDKD